MSSSSEYSSESLSELEISPPELISFITESNDSSDNQAVIEGTVVAAISNLGQEQVHQDIRSIEQELTAKQRFQTKKRNYIKYKNKQRAKKRASQASSSRSASFGGDTKTARWDTSIQHHNRRALAAKNRVREELIEHPSSKDGSS